MSTICLIESTDIERTKLLLESVRNDISLLDEIWLVGDDMRKTYDLIQGWRSDRPLIPRPPDGDLPRFIANQCYRSSCEYILLSDEIVHFHPGSLKRLLDQHRKGQFRVATYITPLDFPRSGYLLQVMGLLSELLLQPWTDNYIDVYRFDNAEARAEAHEVYLMYTDDPHWADFGAYLFPWGENLPETGCCWSGRTMQEIYQHNQVAYRSPSEIFEVIARATGQRNALCGSAWAANLKKDLEASFLPRYESLVKS